MFEDSNDCGGFAEDLVLDAKLLRLLLLILVKLLNGVVSSDLKERLGSGSMNFLKVSRCEVKFDRLTFLIWSSLEGKF